VKCCFTTVRFFTEDLMQSGLQVEFLRENWERTSSSNKIFTMCSIACGILASISGPIMALVGRREAEQELNGAIEIGITKLAAAETPEEGMAEVHALMRLMPAMHPLHSKLKSIESFEHWYIIASWLKNHTEETFQAREAKEVARLELEAREAEEKTRPEVDIVYAWRSPRGRHTYHTAPRRKNEIIAESLFHFFAYTVQKPETDPVYPFIHHLYQEHSIHFEPGHFGETKGDVLFYAFRQQAEGTEPVYDSWDEERKEHILHFDGPEFKASRTSIAFYAYREDPLGLAREASDFKRMKVLNENPIIRVDTWMSVKGKHTFHEAPPRMGETIDDRDYKFFAYGKQVPDTKPVHCFWNMPTEEHTFHFEPDSIEFYAFREQKPGTHPVFTFWNEASQEHTIHFDPAWRGEQKKEVAFYAYKKDPTGV